MDTVAASLSWLGTTAFQLSALAFLVINGLAVAAVFTTRDRGLVNRWTPRLLLVDLLLVGTGVGVPVVARAARLVVEAVSTTSAQHVDLDDHAAPPPRHR